VIRTLVISKRTPPKKGLFQVPSKTLRSGFTLFELLLVLAVVAVLAGLAWPRLMGIIARQNVQSAAEQVRQRLDRGRVKAVEEAVTYQFRYEPYGDRFVLLPNEIVTDPDAESNSLSSSNELTTIERPRVFQLPEGCQFHVQNSLSGESMTMERLPEEFSALIVNGATNSDVSWAPPVLYYPDGTATNAVITVMDEQRNYIHLAVRDLTGAITVSQVSRMREGLGG